MNFLAIKTDRQMFFLFFLYIYNSRDKYMLKINTLLNNKVKVKKVKENIACNNENKITIEK